MGKSNVSKTAADYAAIAVAPVLIFVMISSLSNFLMLILYNGQYSARVSWTLLMYTMGAVAVARIAIEQDRAHSYGYLGALAAAAFIVLVRFIAGSAIFCAGILALIAYLADRIVHDCTLIDDSLDASGQGLIDFGQGVVKQQLSEPKEASSSEEQQKEDDSVAKDDVAGNQVTIRKGHQPGRTVMYLALAALPLFGIGQFLLRSDGMTWATAQRYLALYLFSSLSLLVTTSFLGLRRYLRQRRIDMPRDVTIAWLAGGLVMIALVLGLAYLAPMPGKALASFEVPQFLKSREGLQANRGGWGDEAADKGNPDAKTTEDKNSEGKEIQSIKTRKGAKPGDSGDGNGEKGPSGKQTGGKKSGSEQSSSDQSKGHQKGGEQKSPGQNGQKKTGGQKGGKEQSKQNGPKKNNRQSQNQNKKKGQSKSEQKEDSQRSSDDNQSQNKQTNDSNNKPPTPENANRESAEKPEQEPHTNQQSNEQQEQRRSEQSNDPNDPDNRDQQRDDSSESSEPQSQTKDESSNGSQQESREADDTTGAEQDSGGPSMLDSIGGFFSAIGSILKFIIFAGLAAVVGTYLYLHRHALIEWWNSLWNRDAEPAGQATTLSITEDPAAPKRPFSSFDNPIGSENDPRRVIVITFQAFEAWTREHGWQRDIDETPSEFIRRIGSSLPHIASPATEIVNAYNRIVYGRGKATQSDLDAANQVWHQMLAG